MPESTLQTSRRPEDELTPTIENPFAPQPKRKPAATAAKKTAAKAAPEAPPRPERPLPTARRTFAAPLELAFQEPEKPAIQPGYFLSAIAKQRIQEALSDGRLETSELDEYFKIAKMIAYVLDRQTPTVSDCELAMQMKTFDAVSKVASGEVEIVIQRTDSKMRDQMPRKEVVKYVQQVAEYVLKYKDEVNA